MSSSHGMAVETNEKKSSRCPLYSLEVSLRLRWGACYSDSVAVASGGTGCTLRGWWVIAYTRPDHLCNNWMILFILHDPGDCLDEGIGSFHQRFSLCEWPYHGNEHLFSIFLMRAGLPACICSRIALFSQRFRSHSSIALCASDRVRGGTVRSAGVPSAKMKALSGNVAAGMVVMVITARRMSLSFTS